MNAPPDELPTPSTDARALAAQVEALTTATRVPLVPELKLRLLTHESLRWHRSPELFVERGWGLPYWAFAWPGGQTLARFVLDHPHWVRGRRVLDLGCGGAIEGLAAALAGAAFVVANDVDATVLVAARLNASLNDVPLEVQRADWLQSGDANFDFDFDFDVLLAGDFLYDPLLAQHALGWWRKLRARGVTVLVGDPGRVPFSEGRVPPSTGRRSTEMCVRSPPGPVGSWSSQACSGLCRDGRRKCGGARLGYRGAAHRHVERRKASRFAAFGAHAREIFSWPRSWPRAWARRTTLAKRCSVETRSSRCCSLAPTPTVTPSRASA